MTMHTSLPALNLHVQHAKDLANDILNPKPDYTTHHLPTGYYHSPSYYHGGSFGGGILNYLFPPRVHHYHHVDHTPRRERAKQDKENNLLIFGVAMTALSGLLLYSFGKDWSLSSNAKEDLRRFRQERDEVQYELSYTNISQNRAALYQINRLFNTEEAILKTYKNAADRSLAIKAVTLSGTAIMAYASFVSAPVISVTAGGAIALAGAFAWALNAGLNSTDQTTTRYAQDLKENLAILNTL